MQPHTLKGVLKHLARTLDKAALNQERNLCTNLNYMKTEYLKTKCREKDSLQRINKAVVMENGNKKIIKCGNVNKITVSSA